MTRPPVQHPTIEPMIASPSVTKDDDLNTPSLSVTLRFLIGLAALAISVNFIHANAPLINGFLLALLLVMSVSPLLTWLRRLRLPAPLAYLVTLLVALITLGLIGLVVPAMIAGLKKAAVDLTVNFGALQQSFAGLLASRGVYLAGTPLSELVGSDEWVALVVDFLNRALTSKAFSNVLNSVSVVLMVVLFTVFLLLEALTFTKKVDWQLAQGNPAFDHLYAFARQIRVYVSITAILGLLGGALTVVVLWLIGVEFALLWGFAYFVLGFIPGVGLWLALIPPLLLAFLDLGPIAALLVLVWYIFVSVVIGNVLKPVFMSGDLNLSPLWSIIAMVLWSAILGLPGLILGVPLTIAIRELSIFGSKCSARFHPKCNSSLRPKCNTLFGRQVSRDRRNSSESNELGGWTDTVVSWAIITSFSSFRGPI